MRSLNTSLPPTSPPKRQTPQPPEQLLQAFRSAALSVTNLYKTAASDQARAHDEGYQEALEDLLNFLDRENLGLSDGEGWRVRQWATERFQGTPAVQPPSDSDEEGEEEKRARSLSPTVQQKPGGEMLQPVQHRDLIVPIRPESAPPTSIPARRPSTTAVADPTPLRTEFTFQSNHAYPSHHEIDMDRGEDVPGQAPTAVPSVRVELLSRNARHAARNNGLNSRGSNRLGTSFGSLGSGAGMKRKIPFGDFFDITGFGNGNGRDGPGGGGGKRGRLG